MSGITNLLYPLVYRNGVLLANTDYTSNSSSVTLTTGTSNNDIVAVTGYDDTVNPKGEKGDAGVKGQSATAVYQEFTASNNQTQFTLAGVVNLLYPFVYQNGVLLSNTDYTSNTTAITLTVGASNNDIITISGYDDTINPKGEKGDSGVGGSNTQVLFNDSGNANGSAGFTFNKTSDTISIGNTTVNTTINATSVYLTNNTSNVSLTIPTTTQWANGSFFLNANGSWSLVVSQPAGGNTEVQFNDSGAFAGNTLLTFDRTVPRLSVGNTTVNSQINATSIKATSHIDGNGNALIIRDSANNIIWGG